MENPYKTFDEAIAAIGKYPSQEELRGAESCGKALHRLDDRKVTRREAVAYERIFVALQLFTRDQSVEKALDLIAEELYRVKTEGGAIVTSWGSPPPGPVEIPQVSKTIKIAVEASHYVHQVRCGNTQKIGIMVEALMLLVARSTESDAIYGRGKIQSDDDRANSRRRCHKEDLPAYLKATNEIIARGVKRKLEASDVVAEQYGFSGYTLRRQFNKHGLVMDDPPSKKKK